MRASALFAVLLVAAPALGSETSFTEAYRAALAKAARAFETAQAVDVGSALGPVNAVAKTADQKASAQRLSGFLERAAKLLVPKGAPAPGVGGETLEAAYKLEVLELSRDLGADGTLALENRRRLLANPGVGQQPGANSPGETPQMSQEQVLDNLRVRGQRTMRTAQSMASGLETVGDDGIAFTPAGNGMGSFMQGGRGGAGDLRAGQFRPSSRLTTHSVPETDGGGGVWGSVKRGAFTPWSSAQERYKKFADTRMQRANDLEMEGSRLIEQGGVGNYLKAGWNATRSFGNRLAAGEPKAVTAVAIGTGIALAAVVGVPVIAGGAVVAGIVKAGLVGWTAFAVVKGTSQLVAQPNLVNAGMLALNFVPIPFLGRMSNAAGKIAEKGLYTVGHLSTKTRVTAAGFSSVVGLVQRVTAKEVGVATRSVVHHTAHASGEVVHKVGHEKLHHAAEDSDPLQDAYASMMATNTSH